MSVFPLGPRALSVVGPSPILPPALTPQAPTLMHLIPTPPMFTWGLPSLTRRDPSSATYLPPVFVEWVYE